MQTFLEVLAASLRGAGFEVAIHCKSPSYGTLTVNGCRFDVRMNYCATMRIYSGAHRSEAMRSRRKGYNMEIAVNFIIRALPRLLKRKEALDSSAANNMMLSDWLGSMSENPRDKRVQFTATANGITMLIEDMSMFKAQLLWDMYNEIDPSV